MSDTITLPRKLAESIEQSLGSFVSDHGWSQHDMDNMDSLSAALAQQAEPSQPEYFSQYEYAPDFSVVVSVYRRQKDDVPALIHTETLPKQFGDGEQVAQQAEQAGWGRVPMEPTEAMWSGLARDIVFWLYMNSGPHYGSKMYEHLRNLGTEIPDWLLKEIPDADSTPPKGTVAVVIYKAMVAAAPKGGAL